MDTHQNLVWNNAEWSNLIAGQLNCIVTLKYCTHNLLYYQISNHIGSVSHLWVIKYMCMQIFVYNKHIEKKTVLSLSISIYRFRSLIFFDFLATPEFIEIIPFRKRLLPTIICSPVTTLSSQTHTQHSQTHKIKLINI